MLVAVDQARLTTANTASSINARHFSGRAVLTGGNGNDTILGGTNADSILGGGGVDLLLGFMGDDSIGGSTKLAAGDTLPDGADTILGGMGKDKLFGGLGDDVLSGEEDNDTLSGDGGTDLLFGGPGTDSPASIALPDILDADGVYSNAVFAANLIALLAAFP